MLRNPVSTIITLASRIAEEHPRAASLAYRIRAKAEELRPEAQPRPISAAPTGDHERTLLVSLNDVADRTPRMLADGEVIDLGGGPRVCYLDTPHVPHGWDAGVLYEEASGTLLCGDLFTQLGDGPALTTADIVGPAIAAEDLFAYSSLSPGMGPTIRRLTELSPRTLALMHGPSFTGDGAAALRSLADEYDRRARSFVG